MHCLYCHNPETQHLCNACGICIKACPKQALLKSNGKISYDKNRCIKCDQCIKVCPNFSSPKYDEVSAAEIVKLVKRNQDFLNGITFSGGECTLQSNFIYDVFHALKVETGLTCFIDTNGFITDENLELLCPVTDGFMFDMKSYNAQNHKKLTGLDNERIFRNLRYVSEKGLLYEVRTVIVEGFTDNPPEIEKIARFIKELNDYTLFKLIQFRPIGVKTYMGSLKECSVDLVKKMHQIASGILGSRAVINLFENK